MIKKKTRSLVLDTVSCYMQLYFLHNKMPHI